VNELERVEREAVRSVVVAAGGVTADVGGAMCSAYPPLREHPILNRAMPVDAHVDLDAVESFFEAAGTSFVVAVRPRLASLNRELDGRGYRRAGGWTKFSRDASPAPRVASDLELRAAGPTDAQAFADVLMEGFGGAPQGRDVWTQVPGLRGWHCFLARDGREPAAAGALFVDGDVGWLGAAATRPSFRRRGAQSALLATRVNRARELSVRTLTVETGEPVEGQPGGSYRNILQAGFREEYVRANWLSPR